MKVIFSKKVVVTVVLALGILFANPVKSQTPYLFLSNGLLSDFSCQPWPSYWSQSVTEGRPAPSILVNTINTGSMSYIMHPYVLPQLRVGDRLRCAMDFKFEADSYFELDFGASVTHSCYYNSGYWPLPQINYGFITNTLSHYPTLPTGEILRKDIAYDMTPGVWHTLELFFKPSSGGGYDYEIWIDAQFVVADHSHVVIEPNAEVGILIGDGGSYGPDSFVYYDNILVALERLIDVDIDIKPGTFPNSINLGSKGLIPVAILGTNDFNVDQVNPSTVVFSGVSPSLKGDGSLMVSIEDVNNDGFTDMLFHFNTPDLQLGIDDTYAVLEGMLFNGFRIRGSDSVVIRKN